MYIFNECARLIFLLWAKSLVARGWLYMLIDKHGSMLFKGTKIRLLRNKYKIQCDLTDHVQQQIYFFGCYEPVESFLLQKILKRNNIVIDAGANIGYFSLLFSHLVGPEGQIHSFEPVPKNFKKMEDNIKLNPHATNIILHKSGLWNKKDILEFSLDDDFKNNVGSFTAGKSKKASSKFNCPVDTLDHFIDEQKLEKIDFIKMDIEGSELFALQGFKSLSKFRPIILMEFNQKTCSQFDYNTTDLFRIFDGLNYSYLSLGSNGKDCHWLDGNELIQQSNILIIPSEKINSLKLDWELKDILKYFN